MAALMEKAHIVDALRQRPASYSKAGYALCKDGSLMGACAECDALARMRK